MLSEWTAEALGFGKPSRAGDKRCEVPTKEELKCTNLALQTMEKCVSHAAKKIDEFGKEVRRESERKAVPGLGKNTWAAWSDRRLCRLGDERSRRLRSSFGLQ